MSLSKGGARKRLGRRVRRRATMASAFGPQPSPSMISRGANRDANASDWCFVSTRVESKTGRPLVATIQNARSTHTQTVPLAKLEGSSLGPHRIAQRSLVAYAGGQLVVLYDARQMRTVCTLRGHTHGITAVRWGHTCHSASHGPVVRFAQRKEAASWDYLGLRLYSADSSGCIRVWCVWVRIGPAGEDDAPVFVDALAGQDCLYQQEATLKDGHEGSIGTLAVFPGHRGGVDQNDDYNGPVLVSAGAKGCVLVWNCLPAQQDGNGPSSEPVDTVTFDEWSWGCVQRTSLGLKSIVLSLCLVLMPAEKVVHTSPSMRIRGCDQVLLLVTAGVGRFIRLWAEDVTAGEFRQIARLDGPSDWVRSVDAAVFYERAALDGSVASWHVLLACGGQDKTLRIYRLTFGGFNEEAGSDDEQSTKNEQKTSQIHGAGVTVFSVDSDTIRTKLNADSEVSSSTRSQGSEGKSEQTDSVSKKGSQGELRYFTVVLASLLYAHSDWILNVQWMPCLCGGVAHQRAQFHVVNERVYAGARLSAPSIAECLHSQRTAETVVPAGTAPEDAVLCDCDAPQMDAGRLCGHRVPCVITASVDRSVGLWTPYNMNEGFACVRPQQTDESEPTALSDENEAPDDSESGWSLRTRLGVVDQSNTYGYHHALPCPAGGGQLWAASFSGATRMWFRGLADDELGRDSEHALFERYLPLPCGTGHTAAVASVQWNMPAVTAQSQVGQWELCVSLGAQTGEQDSEPRFDEERPHFLLTTSSDMSTRSFAPWTTHPQTQQELSQQMSNWEASTDLPSDPVRSLWVEVSRPQQHGHECRAVVPVHESEGAPRLASIAAEKVVRVFGASSTFLEELQRVTGFRGFQALLKQSQGTALRGNAPELGLSNKAMFQGDRVVVTKGVMSGEVKTVTETGSRQRTAPHPACPPVEADLISQGLWPEIDKLYGHGDNLVTLACDPAGRWLLCACKARTAREAVVLAWETEGFRMCGSLGRVEGEGKQGPMRFVGHRSSVVDMQFCPSAAARRVPWYLRSAQSEQEALPSESTLLLTVSKDQSWIVWVVWAGRNSELQWRVHAQGSAAHRRVIFCCAWAPDDAFFVTGSRDQTVKVWVHRRMLTAQAKRDCPVFQEWQAASKRPAEGKRSRGGGRGGRGRGRGGCGPRSGLKAVFATQSPAAQPSSQQPTGAGKPSPHSGLQVQEQSVQRSAAAGQDANAAADTFLSTHTLRFSAAVTAVELCPVVDRTPDGSLRYLIAVGLENGEVSLWAGLVCARCVAKCKGGLASPCRWDRVVQVDPRLCPSARVSALSWTLGLWQRGFQRSLHLAVGSEDGSVRVLDMGCVFCEQTAPSRTLQPDASE